MKICTLLFTLFLTVLCGCGHWLFTVGHGDAGQFILQTAERFGGTPTATNGLPRISDQWWYYDGGDRVVIDLSSQAFPAVEAFLHQSFGLPTSDGNKHCLYLFSTNRGYLYLTGSDKDTEILIHSGPMPTLSMMLPNNQKVCKLPAPISQD